jgi:hypothetical protein
MAALGLAVILSVWLGLWGPLDLKVALYAVQKNSKTVLHAAQHWQTLIASMIAFFAARYAYVGAMAKVNFDRDQARQASLVRRLGLFLRLRHALGKLHRQLTDIEAALPSNYSITEKHPLLALLPIRIHTLPISYPTEIEEAWEKLDLIPPQLIFWLSQLRSDVPDIPSRIANIPATLQPTTSLPDGIVSLRLDCGKLRACIRLLMRNLDDEIAEIRKHEGL